MKNTILTIAILTSIAGTLYMPVFGMSMEDGPSTIEVAPSRPPRSTLPRSNQVAPTSMASAATQKMKCTEQLPKMVEKVVACSLLSVKLAGTMTLDAVCFPIGICTTLWRPNGDCQFVCYHTRSALSVLRGQGPIPYNSDDYLCLCEKKDNTPWPTSDPVDDFNWAPRQSYRD